MQDRPPGKKIGYIISFIILIFAFVLFYSDNGEWLGSLVAAFLSAALFLASYIIIDWLIQVFKK